MAHPKLERAIEFANKAHSGIYRGGDHPLPYFAHPMDVLSKVRYLGGVTDQDVLSAAVLHDVLEDTSVTPQEIEDEFGARVLRIVKELTRAGLPAGATREQYFAQLLGEIRAMSPEAWVIKLSDRLANLLDSSRTRPLERTQRYAREALLMLEIIPRPTAPVLWDELQREALEKQ